jgi:hypothetical protein
MTIANFEIQQDDKIGWIEGIHRFGLGPTPKKQSSFEISRT